MTDNRVSSAVEASPIDWTRLDEDPESIARSDVAAIDVELRPGGEFAVGAHGDVVAFVVTGSVVCRFAGGDRTLRAGDSMFIPRGMNFLSHEDDDGVAVARLFVVVDAT